MGERVGHAVVGRERGREEGRGVWREAKGLDQTSRFSIALERRKP